MDEQIEIVSVKVRTFKWYFSTSGGLDKGSYEWCKIKLAWFLQSVEIFYYKVLHMLKITQNAQSLVRNRFNTTARPTYKIKQ